jgi:hypothetical protein
LKDALLFLLDITTPVSQKFLGYLAELAEEKEDLFKLEQLSKVFFLIKFDSLTENYIL